MKKILLLLMVLAAALPLDVLSAADQARIVSVRPKAYVHKQTTRSPARIAAKVSRGNILETEDLGRISLLLPDQMLLKVASKTRFVYDPDTLDDISGILEKGKVWLRGHRKGGAFSVKTPTATTAIRGTEWYIQVADDGSTTIGVMDGQVAVSNEYGRVLLQSREVALVKKGYPPVKAAYVVPENAVNWTLTYLGFWDEPDFARAGPGFAPLIRQAVHAYNQNHLNPMIKILAETESEFGNSAAWLALKGFADLVSGRDRSAALLFKRAADVDPGWALPLAHLALMNLVENKLDKARSFAGKAIEKEPSSSVAHIAAAYVQKAGLKLENAFKAAKKAVALSPLFDPALATAARIALEMDDLKACRTFLKRIGPKSQVLAEKLTIQGYLALRTGNSRQALDIFTQAVELDPEAADALLGKGIALFNTNRVEAGFESMIQATLIAPQVSSLQSYLAKAYIEQQSLDQAGQILERAKRLDPKDPTPFLYQSLNLFERHQPARAALAMDKAQALNQNRAVFRSKYLLDQDNAVLMSNISSLYNELGFNYSSVQRASRALESDPLNAAAYRRLFFSNVFEVKTRPLHQQEMETEKLLAKLLIPPTLNGMIFTPEGLQPYQPMFAVSGTDAVISGNAVLRQTRQADLTVASGYVGLVTKPDYPAALAVSVMPNVQETDTAVSSFGSTTTSDTDLDSVNTLATAKYQISPVITLFGELNGSNSEVDTASISNSGNSIVTDLGAAGSFFTDTSSTTKSATLTDSDLYTMDAGARIRMSPTLSVLVHTACSRNQNNIDSDVTTNTATTFGGTGFPTQTTQDSSDVSQDTDTEDKYRIIQTTVWKKWQAHFFETGLRYFGSDSRIDTDGAVVSNIDKAFYSAFFSHQYKPFSDLYLNWGLSADKSQYETETGIDDDNWFAGGHIGAVWQPDSNWTLRSAVVKNAAGDGKRRLQRPVNSGFPVMSLSSDELLGGGDGSAFHLEHETFSAAIDFKADSYPFFAGIEYARDRGDTIAFDTAAGPARLHRKSRSHNVAVYVETLLSQQLSLGASWSFSDIQADEAVFSYTGHRNRFQAGVSWFLPQGLSMKLSGVLEETDLDISVRNKSLQPEINWYTLQNHLRVNLKGKWEENAMSGVDDHVDEISLNLFWYY